MRKMIILGLAALFVAASQVPSEAGGRRSARMLNGNRSNLFSRIAEFERAKNQWLFGR